MSNLSTRKGVHFPVSVLLQQAITEGDIQEIRQLISEHGNKVVEEREPSGLPPVMRTVFEGQLDCLKTLVSAGAELTARDPEGWNALHVAAAMDDIEAAKYITKMCNEPLTQVRNVDDQRPMDLAESPEMARYLLKADLYDLRIETSLSKKSFDPSEATVLQAVRDHHESNANVEFLNIMLQSQSEFDTLLHLAAARNYPRLARYVLKHELVDPDVRDREGFTPIHIASYNSSTDALLLLIEYGASIHSLTNSYEKPSDLTNDELILEILAEEEIY
jgi:ankyrin repeat protein